MWAARDKNQTLHIHDEKPIRAQYGRGIDDSFWESEGAKRPADALEKLVFASLEWSSEPVEIKIKGDEK